MGRHLLIKAVNEASQGRMPLVYGPPVYVQANGIQTPEQLGKSKNPEVQVAAVEAAGVPGGRTIRNSNRQITSILGLGRITAGLARIVGIHADTADKILP